MGYNCNGEFGQIGVPQIYVYKYKFVDFRVHCTCTVNLTNAEFFIRDIVLFIILL